MKSPVRRRGSSNLCALCLEAGSATAGALHVRVLELEARALEGLDVVDNASRKIHERGRVHENLQTFKLEDFVHGSGAILKLHAVLEARAAATDYSHTQTCGDRILLRHDLFYLGDGVGSQVDWGRLLHFRNWRSSGCGRHL